MRCAGGQRRRRRRRHGDSTHKWEGAGDCPYHSSAAPAHHPLWRRRAPPLHRVGQDLVAQLAHAPELAQPPLLPLRERAAQVGVGDRPVGTDGIHLCDEDVTEGCDCEFVG
eukprot:scaffold147494_cov30-Tisochrysis_lutea.AAC.1